jgi:heptosyltransferase-2
MGNVLVTTTLLPAIKRTYPESTVFWVTLKNAAPLLLYNQYIDNVFVWEPESWLILQAMHFDLVMNVDKSSHACAFMMSLTSRKKVGYGLKGDGAIIPLDKDAEYNYRLGLDDYAKFRINQKSNSQLLTEAMGLRFHCDEYLLQLSDEELEFCHRYKRSILSNEPPLAAHRSPLMVGFNTGCSLLYPNKKLTIDQQVILIDELSKREGIRLLLLGGPEDTARNAEIARQVGAKVINTPTTEGLRRGICYENVCDLVITGDSLGMHIAIALKKHVLVWFGVSCPQEVDLFGRGAKFIPEGLACSPCWKKECPYNLECMQMVDLEGIVAEVDNYRRGLQ